MEGPVGARRGALLRKVGDLIAANAERLAELEVRDNGKLINEMLVQLKTIPQWFYYYGGLADKVEGGVLPIDKPDHFVFTTWEPLGVVAAITAWNSPLLLLTWKLAPGLAAGNTFVVKPSEYASASTVAFAELFAEAGFPAGVVNVVCGTGQQVGVPLVAHPDVAKIAFTGSDAAGKAINKAAAGDLKHVTLELGGKSPNIVFEDADLEAAAAGVASGIFAAAGQTCIAGSRLLLQRSIYDTFLSKIRTTAEGVKVGDPLDPETQGAAPTSRNQEGGAERGETGRLGGGGKGAEGGRGTVRSAGERAGRESGQEMIKSYMQPKTVWLNNSAERPENPFVMRLT